MESAYPTHVINFVHGVGRLLLRRWKSGLADYYSVIFTRRDAGIKRLEDLQGKTIVFEDAGSTSGYLLPKLYLLRRGLKLAERNRFNANSLATDVGYVFAYSREKLVDLVLTRRVDAGACSNDDYGSLEDKKKLDIAGAGANGTSTAPLAFRAQRSGAGAGRSARGDFARDA